MKKLTQNQNKTSSDTLKNKTSNFLQKTSQYKDRNDQSPKLKQPDHNLTAPLPGLLSTGFTELTFLDSNY